MAPTLRTVVDLYRPVRWVAVSELEDPTPFLEGGELVLTTGMRLGTRGASAYIARLVRGAATGLGFGVGLGHEEVPAALVKAATAQGLPLVEVPRPTPFIAIGKAVSGLLAAEEYAEIGRAATAQRALTRAAIQGPERLVDRIAAEVGGWALLLDDAGAVRHAAPRSAVARAEEIGPELIRLRLPGPASASITGPDSRVVIQALGERGFLAVGASTPLSIGVVNTAASLLTLALSGAGRDAVRLARSAVVDVLLGDLPSGPIHVLACDADESLLDDPSLADSPAALRNGIVVIIGPDGLVPAVSAYGPVGVSAAVEWDALPVALSQAKAALVAARRSGSGVVRYGELPGQGLLALVDEFAAPHYAAAVLAPLTESRADLITTLRAYLAHNGHWDAAAQELRMHRHTLRYRMRRVAELLGRDLDDAGVRAELWYALALI